MFKLEMQVGKKWHDVGDFEEMETAEFCVFDITKNYRILNKYGEIIKNIPKQGNRRDFV